MELLEINKALNNGAYLLFAEARDPNKWEEIKTSHYYREMQEIEVEAK